MADWKVADLSDIIGIPDEVRELTELTRGLISPTVQFLEIVSAVLNIIKAFVSDEENAVAIAANEVQEALTGFLNDAQSTGIYMYIDSPLQVGENGNFTWGDNTAGGFDGFKQRLIGKLVDPTDPNRPAFSRDASFAFFVFGINSGNVLELIQQLGSLTSLLGQQFVPSLEPPTNVQARAVNQSFVSNYVDAFTGRLSPSAIEEEFPLLINEKMGSLPTKRHIFTSDLTQIAVEGDPDAIVLQWQAPNTMIPTAFVIERSQIRGGSPASSVDSNGNPQLEKQETNIPDQDNKGAKISRKEVVVDDQGRTVTVYKDFRNDDGSPKKIAIHIPTPDEVLANRYTFTDSTAETGIPYFYRVRAKFFGESGAAASSEDLIELPQDIKSSFIGRTINGIVHSVNQFRIGEGEPSEEVSAYIPEPEDRQNAALLKDATQDRIEDNHFFAGPPNWSRLSVEQLFPYLGILFQVLEDSVRKIKTSARSDASEIEGLIDTLQLKIDVLNRILVTIDTIISLIDGISLPGFATLFAADASGGIPEIINQISSSGNSPESSPDDFAAGVLIMAGGPGSEHLSAALQLLLAPIVGEE